MSVHRLQSLNRGYFKSLSEFQYISKLGTGSFGSVHLYQHLASKRRYAIKQILGETITTPYELEGIEREIRVQLRCRFKHIIQLHDAFVEDNNINMVLEYVENGNLFSYIQQNPPLSESEACKYFSQTCQALQYMHSHNFYHRDIKPENLLLDANNDIKICDFGWCAENINQKRKTFCGTYEYMAPEIVMDTMYDYRIDIWSVGILLYELLHKNAPFRGKDYNEIANNIKICQPKVKSYVSKDAQCLILKILQLEPSNRPTFQQIFQSSFVKRHNQLINMIEQLQENIQPTKSYQQSTHQPSSQNLIQMNSPSQQKRYVSPKRRITEYTSSIKQEIRMRMPSPKLPDQQTQRLASPTTRVYVSPARRMKPKKRDNQDLKKTGPLDLKGVKDATKIVYMSLQIDFLLYIILIFQV
ncbi:hypothetical protein pb186bvf_001577 [Paramecium bursaria]